MCDQIRRQRAGATSHGSVEQALVTARPVWTEDGWQDAHVYARLELPVGAQVIGPAVLEQPDATTYLIRGYKR